jgi:hypothetical protein
MITAGFLPACTAVWHRAVLELVRAGWWQDLPGADRWTVVVWLAIPAAAATLLAIAAAALSGARALIVLVGLAGFIHPMLPLVLAPLALAVRTWPARPALVPPAIFAAASWALAVWLTPSCVDPWRDPVAPLRLAAAWGTIIGLAGGALLAIDALFSRLGRWSQLAAALLLVIAGGALVSGRATDAPALLGASGAALWWRPGRPRFSDAWARSHSSRSCRCWRRCRRFQREVCESRARRRSGRRSRQRAPRRPS